MKVQCGQYSTDFLFTLVVNDMEKACIEAFFEWLEVFVDSTLAIWFPFVSVQISIGDHLDQERPATILAKI